MEKSPTLELKRVESNAATTIRATMVLTMIEEAFVILRKQSREWWVLCINVEAEVSRRMISRLVQISGCTTGGGVPLKTQYRFTVESGKQVHCHLNSHHLD
jgi:hypothetical protein